MPEEASHKPRTDRFLVLSAHDYRSPRQANIHFITSELAKRGPTRFFSLKYSFLSHWTSDWRLSLDAQANSIVTYNGVDCYLWKSLVHPFNTRRKWLYPLEAMMHAWYRQGFNPVLRRWIREASVILLESGIAPIFTDLIRQLNPRARILYRASDALDTINVANYVRTMFDRVAADIDTIGLPSRALASGIASRDNLKYIPHGIDHGLREMHQERPFGPGVHAVSVGSMLFDPDFFIAASRLFPHITFHVIGCGQERHPDYADNVLVYGEMPFAETLAYIRHADFGIAPYASDNLPAYLKDTSMKLIQYDFFGKPAVCPEFVAAGYPSRFGYQIGNADSIRAAIDSALTAGNELVTGKHLSWSEVTDRMLNPDRFRDTSMSEELHSMPDSADHPVQAQVPA